MAVSGIRSYAKTDGRSYGLTLVLCSLSPSLSLPLSLPPSLSHSLSLSLWRRWASQYGVVFTDIPVFMTLAAFLFVSYNNMCSPAPRDVCMIYRIYYTTPLIVPYNMWPPPPAKFCIKYILQSL